MKYDLPNLPKGQRWLVKPSVAKTITVIKLQEKRFFGWRTLADTAIYNTRVAEGGIEQAARRLLSEYKTDDIEYGTQEGTL